MSNNRHGLKFYQVFKFGDVIGVNQLTFGEVIGTNIVSVFVIFAIIALTGTFFPLLCLLLHSMTCLADFSTERFKNRITITLLSFVGYIYFIIDYYYAFFGSNMIHYVFGPEALEKVVYYNTWAFVINLILLFGGNKFLEYAGGFILNLAIFVFFSYQLHNIGQPLIKGVANLIFDEYKPNIVKDSPEETYNYSEEESYEEKY